MAKTKISEFSATPANNTDIDGININEGCAPSGINDAIRELMAQLKDFQTGAVGDSFNGPVGTTTAAAGAFTTLSASSTVSGTGFSTYLASPPAIGGTAAAAGSFTTLSASGAVTLSGGTANGVAYLNGSKVVTSGSALTFDGSTFTVTRASAYNARFAYDSPATYYTDIGYGGTNTVAPSNPFYYFSLGGSEQMRLTSTGLGIGTSSPAEKLEVAGNILIKNSGNPTLTVKATGAGNDPKIYLTADTNSFILNGAFSPSTDLLEFKYNSSSLMALDQNGNLGLGVTPSAWSTLKAFQINQSSLASYANNTYLMNNVFYDGTNYKYINSSTAARYDLSNNTHLWYTAPSGTAGNAITFTQAMTLTAGGNLGVGTTSPAYKLEVIDDGNGIQARLKSSSSNGTALSFSNTATNGRNWRIGSNFVTGNGEFAFYDDTASAERARIDSSGNLLVNTTSTAGSANNKIAIKNTGQTDYGLTISNTNTSTNDAIGFFNNSGTRVGSVSFTTTATSYNTSSDYRLKNTIAPMTGALAKVALLKPVTYKWNADGSDGEGFIAHELAEVCPDAVTGAKDAVDEDGNPKYQGIDTSFLVATLTAALQELNAKFDAYVASHP